MTDKNVVISVTPAFSESVPKEPETNKSLVVLSTLASQVTAADDSKKLVCRNLLEGDTQIEAKQEASQVLTKIMSNTQILSVFGTDALDAVNRLNDRMLEKRPTSDIPELQEAMKDLSKSMRGIGRKYDPSDPKVIRKYQQTKNGILSIFRTGRNFLADFLDDIRTMQQIFERVTDTLEGKQEKLLENITFYDEYYVLNEDEIDKIVYKIGVMEYMRDYAAQMADQVTVGKSEMGDRGSEDKAKIAELVTILENKIMAFKARLWVAWAMAPQIRNMRAINVGLSARIDQTIGITIPTMKSTIGVWLTLNEAQQSEQFNAAVEQTYNQVLTGFANAAKIAVPAIVNALSTPAMDPRTVIAWSESLSAQADGIITALETARQKRVELEEAMINGKKVIDASTNRINEAQLQYVLENVEKEPLKISRSVSE